MAQAKFLGVKPAHGLLGSLVDHEWVHFVYNTGLYVLLILGTVAVLREGRTRAPVGWLWLGAAIAVQSYHSVEHTVKIFQHVQTGADPAPGILGQIFDLIWLHFTVNAIVTICMVGAFVGLGMHREVAPAVQAGLRCVRRPVVLAAVSVVFVASVAGIKVRPRNRSICEVPTSPVPTLPTRWDCFRSRATTARSIPHMTRWAR